MAKKVYLLNLLVEFWLFKNYHRQNLPAMNNRTFTNELLTELVFHLISTFLFLHFPSFAVTMLTDENHSQNYFNHLHPRAPRRFLAVVESPTASQHGGLRAGRFAGLH